MGYLVAKVYKGLKKLLAVTAITLIALIVMVELLGVGGALVLMVVIGLSRFSKGRPPAKKNDAYVAMLETNWMSGEDIYPAGKAGNVEVYE